MTWDLIPGIDQQGYGAWAKKAIGSVLQSSGVIEFRANRNLAGSPQILVVTEWAALSDWANFAEKVWPSLESEGRSFFTNFSTVLWGPSPVVPQPLHPPK